MKEYTEQARTCEICEGIYDGYMITHLKTGRRFKKKSFFTFRSKNPLRCMDCQYVERRKKGRCFICGDRFRHTLKEYISNGNTCPRCMLNINNKLK